MKTETTIEERDTIFGEKPRKIKIRNDSLNPQYITAEWFDGDNVTLLASDLERAIRNAAN